MVGKTLHQLGSRILRAITPIALSASLIAAGCETLPEPEVVETPFELRAGDDGPSAAIIKNGEKIADAIVEDEAFIELVEVAAGVMGDLQKAQQKRTGEELDAIAVTTTEPSFAEVMGPGALLKHLGGDPKNLDHIRNLVNEIRENHDLEAASPQDVRYVFELAFDTDEGNDILEDAAEDELVFALAGQCELACTNAYILAMVIPLALFILEMVLAAVFFPFGILIAMFAIAQLNWALTVAGAALNQCLAACDGVPADNGGGELCGGDICQQDEYCWKGVLGIGKDECRSKKKQGNVCSNHGQCQTDCCKLHTWSNPVSKTCRPANACN